ncbi:MAG: asparaginase [Phycisphaerae bacterium]
MQVAIVMTGGTIAKTYDEAHGELALARPVIERIVGRLRLPDLDIGFKNLFAKDSRDLTDNDRLLILEVVRHAADARHRVVIVHGTDTLVVTGELLCRSLESVAVPVIITGAMRPYEFRDSDALQNITEALLAVRIAEPGVYVAMHNRLLRFPGVVKDHARGTFAKPAQHDGAHDRP